MSKLPSKVVQHLFRHVLPLMVSLIVEIECSNSKMGTLCQCCHQKLCHISIDWQHLWWIHWLCKYKNWKGKKLFICLWDWHLFPMILMYLYKKTRYWTIFYSYVLSLSCINLESTFTVPSTCHQFSFKGIFDTFHIKSNLSFFCSFCLQLRAL